MNIKKGDSVLIRAGKDNGKSGIVERVFPKVNKVIIQNLHLFKKHRKPSKLHPHGGIVDISMPMDISNISLICSQCKKCVRLAFKSSSTGKLRICKKCGETI